MFKYLLIIVINQDPKLANLVKVLLSQLISSPVSGVKVLSCNNSRWVKTLSDLPTVTRCANPPRWVFVA